MSAPTDSGNEAAIGRDLEACDLGLAVTSGRTRALYAAHREACFAALRELNRADGLEGMSDVELLRALEL